MKWNFTLELLLKRVLYALTPGDWNFFWFQTSAARSLSLQSVLRLLTNPWSHVLQPQFFFLSTLNLSGETLCQKLHFMYYRRPLREYSCVINFHFKAKSSWNDVSEWVWSGANSNGNKKNEINNNAQRETASHSVYTPHVWACTHTPSGHGFDFLPCYLIWLSYESRFLTACGEPLTIPSSHLYYTTYAVSPPANPPPPPPPQSP